MTTADADEYVLNTPTVRAFVASVRAAIASAPFRIGRSSRALPPSPGGPTHDVTPRKAAARAPVRARPRGSTNARQQGPRGHIGR